MKYWKGRTGTAKEGMFGTMDDAGSVPDADECTKAEYDAYANSRDIPVKKNWKYLYGNSATDAAKLDIIAQFLKLK